MQTIGNQVSYAYACIDKELSTMFKNVRAAVIRSIYSMTDQAITRNIKIYSYRNLQILTISYFSV